MGRFWNFAHGTLAQIAESITEVERATRIESTRSIEQPFVKIAPQKEIESKAIERMPITWSEPYM